MAEITKEQIEAWKKKHKNVYKISTEGKVAYLKSPDRKALSYASTTKDPMKFNEIILNQCWLGGDEEIKTDDSLFLSVSGKLADIIQIKEAELEKL